MIGYFGDNGDGSYCNPIIYRDYSDPDVIRVGNDYYMTAGSFCNTPGLPILHSRDLVNWSLISYALENIPFESYSVPRHGCGVWAPSIRYFNGEFIIFFPMPDEGIFTVRTQDPAGKWSDPVCVYEGAGWIDPCPFTDDDGKCYMVNAFAKSRIGFKSRLQIAELSPGLDKITSVPVMVFDGEAADNETIEGPKLYKHNGWYYIFAPAGGVKQGWQTVLRSKNIYGPYEHRRVMEQKDTPINGPHQGAWIDTPSGEDWFIHFQDVNTGGRIVHLQPMKWVDDWPVIGTAAEGESCGKPVIRYRKPNISNEDGTLVKKHFESKEDVLNWQWNANHKDDWAEFRPYSHMGDEHCKYRIRLKSVAGADSVSDQPNLLLQKWPAPAFEVKTKLATAQMKEDDEAGMICMGETYGAVGILKTGKGFEIRTVFGKQRFENEKAHAHDEVRTVFSKEGGPETGEEIWFMMGTADDIVTFSYSFDGVKYTDALAFIAAPGRWVGAKCGIYVRNIAQNEGGYAYCDSFEIT